MRIGLTIFDSRLLNIKADESRERIDRVGDKMGIFLVSYKTIREIAPGQRWKGGEKNNNHTGKHLRSVPIILSSFCLLVSKPEQRERAAQKWFALVQFVT